MKKNFFMLLFLSLTCSPLAYSIQAPKLTNYSELSSSDFKKIAQRIVKLSPVKKVAPKRIFFKTLDQLSPEKKVIPQKISAQITHADDTIDVPVFFYLLLRDALFP